MTDLPDTDVVVDPHAVPGSYEKTEAGFVRTDEATAPADAPIPTLSIDDAQALADASAHTGFPPPPHVQAVLDDAKAKARDAARAARDAGKPNKPTATPAAPAGGETKE